MKKDTAKTDVLFLIEPPIHDEFGENIFAFFPTQIWDGKGNKGSYSHLGQHSGCCKEYADQCKKATPDQYNDLKIELEGLGYDLNVLN